jgi:hypothetical protein
VTVEVVGVRQLDIHHFLASAEPAPGTSPLLFHRGLTPHITLVGRVMLTTRSGLRNACLDGATGVSGCQWSAAGRGEGTLPPEGGSRGLRDADGVRDGDVG